MAKENPSTNKLLENILAELERSRTGFVGKDRYAVDRTRNPLEAYTKNIDAAFNISTTTPTDLILVEDREGFFDFLYLMVNLNPMVLVIELDRRVWFTRSFNSIRSIAAGLGVLGMFGFIGVQTFVGAPTLRYGITLFPRENTVPFYKRLHIRVEPSGAAAQGIISGLIGYRLRGGTRV